MSLGRSLQVQFDSDSTLSVRWSNEPSEETSRQVIDTFHALRAHFWRQTSPSESPIKNFHPAYCSLTIDFDPLACKPQDLRNEVGDVLKRGIAENAIARAPVTIPVQYDGEDLAALAVELQISEKELVELHGSREYLVAFLGFTPGFPYLLGLPERLHCRRKSRPRLRVPSGSVALAGRQTGIYPSESPGGWQLIGKTDAPLFSPHGSPPTLLEPGDRVRFLSQPLSQKMAANVGTLPLQTKKIIEVLRPGMYSTLQDLGRLGWAHLGVSPGGAADPLSLRAANCLVGNHDGATAIEMQISGGSFRFLDNTWFALTGADCLPRLDGYAIAMGVSLPVSAGQILELGSMQDGLRSYLAVHGGVGATPILGSHSQFVSGGWGGLGRELRSGDRLAPGDEATTDPAFRRYLPRKTEEPFRVTRGTQFDLFTPETCEHFFSASFVVTNDVNRLGLRLDGPDLELASPDFEMASEGIANGAIQVASGGQAMILYCEQQSTGGYPKIANVIRADLHRLGQLRPGDRVKFIEVGYEHAWRLNADLESWFAAAIQSR